MAPRGGGVKREGNVLCEECSMFQGWVEPKRNPRGVKLALCKAVGAPVQPPYDRCPAFKPKAS
ncbi:MAG: hypothetical protein DRJ97_00425 [Thermoprotei archaeon]|nr:MAG: hypothetical protein DRJ97_00425 [Thermoprotei archaeon]